MSTPSETEKQAKYGIAKQRDIWWVHFYPSRYGCHEGLIGSTQKSLLANGAQVKLGRPIPHSRSVDYRMITETSRVSDYQRDFGLEEPSDKRASNTQIRQTRKESTLPKLQTPKTITKLIQERGILW